MVPLAHKIGVVSHRNEADPAIWGLHRTNWPCLPRKRALSRRPGARGSGPRPLVDCQSPRMGEPRARTPGSRALVGGPRARTLNGGGFDVPPKPLNAGPMGLDASPKGLGEAPEALPRETKGPHRRPNGARGATVPSRKALLPSRVPSRVRGHDAPTLLEWARSPNPRVGQARWSNTETTPLS